MRAGRARRASLVPPVHASVLSDATTMTSVRLVTGGDCKLAVGIYPQFSYDASSGGGVGTCSPIDAGRLQLAFDPQSMCVCVCV